MKAKARSHPLLTHLRSVDRSKSGFEFNTALPIGLSLFFVQPPATVVPRRAIDPADVHRLELVVAFAVPTLPGDGQSRVRKEIEEKVFEDLIDDLGREGGDGEARGRGRLEKEEGGRPSSETEEGEEEPSWLALLVGVDDWEKAYRGSGSATSRNESIEDETRLTEKKRHRLDWKEGGRRKEGELEPSSSSNRQLGITHSESPKRCPHGIPLPYREADSVKIRKRRILDVEREGGDAEVESILVSSSLPPLLASCPPSTTTSKPRRMSSSTSASPPFLPNEIKKEILKFCDQPTLAKTSSLSLAFLQLSSPLLYRHIVFEGPEGLTKFLTLVVSMRFL